MGRSALLSAGDSRPATAARAVAGLIGGRPKLASIMEGMKMSVVSLSLVVTVLLAFLGYAAAYVNSLVLTRRKEQLELVSKQINEFYGPLYLSCRASNIAFKAFSIKLGDVSKAAAAAPAKVGDLDTLKEWRLWIGKVLMPMNQRVEDTIMTGAHLIEEETVPDCILRFIAHNAAWKAVMCKWEQGDWSDQFSIVPYPKELGSYAESRYAKLKKEQLRLIGRLKRPIKLAEMAAPARGE